MRKITILAVTAVVLLIVGSPAFAGWRDDFYPGDAPPYAAQADGGHSTASGVTAAGIGDASGTPDGGTKTECGASGCRIQHGYDKSANSDK